MALKITISFKEDTPEEKLFEHVKQQFNYSSYIKNLIKKDIESKEQPKKEEKFNLINF